ncbi:hypothetical protein WAK64_09955 [Bacillus spongiae]|uniref:VOC domain-containing protein n=1 Tax=Bacillus spongiae TaxID=2683610 RepID=A0ABU8HDX4_9BACI
MQLFHYHWWTDKLEDMENFYHQLGFETTIRVGKYNGEMQTFHPPLKWDDFRDKGITFRIIEMVKGQTNITFGHGKKDMFDHIGLLVDETEYTEIMGKAKELNWRINEGDRRTFIFTPWHFKIELQKRNDVISKDKHTFIDTIEIDIPFKENPELIGSLLNLDTYQQNNDQVKVGDNNWNIVLCNSADTRLKSVYFSDGNINESDPVGAHLKSSK